jgi:hypothetical protein
MWTAGSPPLACPRRPATAILPCTGRPFRQWLPALGKLRQPAGSSAHRPPASSRRLARQRPGHLSRAAMAVGGDAHCRPFALYHVAWLMASRGDPAPREPPEAVTVRGEGVEVVARCRARTSHSPADTNDIWHDASDGPCRGCCTVVTCAHLHPQTVSNFPGRYTGACGHRHVRGAQWRSCRKKPCQQQHQPFVCRNAVNTVIRRYCIERQRGVTAEVGQAGTQAATMP